MDDGMIAKDLVAVHVEKNKLPSEKSVDVIATRLVDLFKAVMKTEINDEVIATRLVTAYLANNKLPLGNVLRDRVAKRLGRLHKRTMTSKP